MDIIPNEYQNQILWNIFGLKFNFDILQYEDYRLIMFRCCFMIDQVTLIKCSPYTIGSNHIYMNP